MWTFPERCRKNDSDTEKRSPRPQCVPPPSYRCVRNLSRIHGVTEHSFNAAATAYIHIKVAIVTHLHFGSAKPKFHTHCWSSISINDRGCQQRCVTRPANILTCTYSFIFTIYQSTGKQQRITHPYSYLYAQWNEQKLYFELRIFFCAGTVTSVSARQSNVNNIWLADATHPSRAAPPFHITST